MRLASNSDGIHGAGGEVIAISIDGDVRQAGMYRRWPTPDVLYVGDPDRSRFIGPLELGDPDDERGLALPAMLVIGPDGDEVYRYVGRDFADRTTDDEVYEALEALDLGSIDPPGGGPVVEVPDDLDRFFRPEHLVPYFKGNRFGAAAIGSRTDDAEFRAIARQHGLMADATLDAWSSLGAS